MTRPWRDLRAFAHVTLLLASCGAPNKDFPAFSGPLQPVFQTGTGAESDTVLLMPYRLYLWRTRLVALELTPRVTVFDTLGHVQWMYGRTGSGPAELKEPSAVATAPNGNLWVLDPGNTRIIEFDSAGQVVITHSTAHLPLLGTDLVVLRDQVLFFAPRSENNLLRAALPDLKVLAIETLPWSDSIPRRAHIVLSTAADVQAGTWVAAHEFGGLFYLGTQTGPTRPFRYVDHIDFEVMLPPIRVGTDGQLRVPDFPERVDVKYGAKQISLVRNEIFMLSGGRPARPGQDPQPTERIDVYTTNGAYLRSYRLPFDADAMATDGRSFFLLRTEPHPMLVGLRAP
jgi:hypothetical protein